MSDSYTRFDNNSNFRISERNGYKTPLQVEEAWYSTGMNIRKSSKTLGASFNKCLVTHLKPFRCSFASGTGHNILTPLVKIFIFSNIA
jgi:hypothetical protein